MWVFQNKQGEEFKGDLRLDWEVNGTPLSDTYTPDDTDATQLWKIWLEEYGRREHPQLGAGWAPIYWFVTGQANTTLGIAERAPFAYDHGVDPGETFIDVFSWPRDEQTKERLRWSTLPVEDKAWLPGRADKGGFVQQATGWKPSPYQPLLHLPSLAQAAGLPH